VEEAKTPAPGRGDQVPSVFDAVRACALPRTQKQYQESESCCGRHCPAADTLAGATSACSWRVSTVAGRGRQAVRLANRPDDSIPSDILVQTLAPDLQQSGQDGPRPRRSSTRSRSWRASWAGSGGTSRPGSESAVEPGGMLSSRPAMRRSSNCWQENLLMNPRTRRAVCCWRTPMRRPGNCSGGHRLYRGAGSISRQRTDSCA